MTALSDGLVAARSLDRLTNTKRAEIQELLLENAYQVTFHI